MQHIYTTRELLRCQNHTMRQGLNSVVFHATYFHCSGESGSMVLQSVRVTPRGSLYTEGVDTQRIGSDYYWHPVCILVSFLVSNFCRFLSYVDEYDTDEFGNTVSQVYFSSVFISLYCLP